MMKQRKQYTTEFKQGAVLLVTEQGRTIDTSPKNWTLGMLGFLLPDLHPIIGQFRELKFPLFARLGFVATVPQTRWRSMIKRAMRTQFIVIFSSCLDDLSSIIKRSEPVLIQAFLPHSSVEAFDDSLVRGSSGVIVRC